MYAAGGIIVSFAQAFAYRNYQPRAPITALQKTILLLASLVYGLIIGSVAIEFPKGSIVALIFCVVYGFGVLGTLLVRNKQMLKLGSRPVIQYFFYSYCVG